MVLKNSKWDKQAKHKYLKKHGLLKPKTSNKSNNNTPKWSGKVVDSAQDNVGGSNDSDTDDNLSNWSDEDEEILNEMFPQLGSEGLTKEQREKVKKQILEEMLEAEERKAEELKELQRNKYNDGIYLGKDQDPIEVDSESMDDSEQKSPPLTLEEYISKDISLTRKSNRKLPKHRLKDDLLSEYGIESYADTVNAKNVDDYNDLYYSKQKKRSLAKIPTEELINFRIGEDTLGERTNKHDIGTSAPIRELTEVERDEYKAIEERARHADFLKSIKAKFDPKAQPLASSSKVLEINNLNLEDQTQIDNLERRILRAGDAKSGRDRDEDFDLDELLGDLHVSRGITSPLNPPGPSVGITRTYSASASESVSTFSMSSSVPNEAQSPSQWSRKNDIDSFLSDLTTNDAYITTGNSSRKFPSTATDPSSINTSSRPRNLPPPTDEDFLDDLLG